MGNGRVPTLSYGHGLLRAIRVERFVERSSADSSAAGAVSVIYVLSVQLARVLHEAILLVNGRSAVRSRSPVPKRSPAPGPFARLLSENPLVSRP